MKTKKLSSLALPHRIKFALPAKTLICIKRKIRSEVLHAFNKTGKGGARAIARAVTASVKSLAEAFRAQRELEKKS